MNRRPKNSLSEHWNNYRKGNQPFKIFLRFPVRKSVSLTELLTVRDSPACLTEVPDKRLDGGEDGPGARSSLREKVLHRLGADFSAHLCSSVARPFSAG